MTTCACGKRAKDCAVRLMTKFVGDEDVGVDWNDDFGPLIGVQRGFKTKEKWWAKSGGIR